MTISFAVQGELTTRTEWLDLARRADDLGFEAVAVADHPGLTPSPFVALAAAAQVTSHVLLTTAVVNAGAWEPLTLASEVATLDVVSDGRAMLGLGAGHTPREWTQVGREYPTAPDRLAQLATMVSAVRRLLAGERVTLHDGAVHLDDAAVGWRPAERAPVPVLLGGHARSLVRTAARHADVLELTGLGRTLPDGHAHAPAWSAATFDERVALLRTSGGGSVRLGALVQKVEITADRRGAAEEYRRLIGHVVPDDDLPSLDDLLDTPYVLIGTPDEIVAQLRAHEARWGLTRYTVRAPAIDDVASIIERLA